MKTETVMKAIRCTLVGEGLDSDETVDVLEAYEELASFKNQLNENPDLHLVDDYTLGRLLQTALYDAVGKTIRCLGTSNVDSHFVHEVLYNTNDDGPLIDYMPANILTSHIQGIVDVWKACDRLSQETPNQPSIEPQYTEASPMCIGLSVGNTITAIKKRMED